MDAKELQQMVKKADDIYEAICNNLDPVGLAILFDMLSIQSREKAKEMSEDDPVVLADMIQVAGSVSEGLGLLSKILLAMTAKVTGFHIRTMTPEEVQKLDPEIQEKLEEQIPEEFKGMAMQQTLDVISKAKRAALN